MLLNMNNHFRNPTMKACFAAAVRGFETRHKDFFHAGGTPNRGNSPAGYFWRGYEGAMAGTWDAASKQMMGYAYWKAGVACREAQH